MRHVAIVTLLACGAMLAAAGVAAQTAAPPAAGGTADGVPFDIPYGMPVGLETARKMIAAAEAEAAKHRWK
jgi:glc operon protein GlcG